MKNNICAIGVFALAFVVGGLPSATLAANSDSDDGVRTEARAQAKEQESQIELTSLEARSSGEQEDREEVRGGQQGVRGIELELEDDEDMATSFADLEKKIEKRKHELDQEAASTTPANRDIVENANPVRLAVHSLLASKELLGGIGQQVSEIAHQMNDSVGTTTNAEAKIQSRSFFMKLLFGGDSASADMIAQEVAQNQQRIDDLTKLLNAVNLSPNIRATIEAQIVALQNAQTRLQALAEKEKKQWGLFSWRF